MASMIGLLWLLLSIKCCLCFHCAKDVDLPAGSDKIYYPIETHPKLGDTSYWITEGEHAGMYAAKEPRFPNKNYYTYWISNMEFYLFGYITSPNAVIHMGFYSADALVYGATVDCGAGTWKTEYTNATNPTNTVWKSGKLLEKCEQWSTFDLDYELQQPHRSKFLFNGQPLDIGLYPKYKNDRRSHSKYWTSYYRTSKLPVDLTTGPSVKATITGGTLTRYAYGKCFAFPHALRENCTAAAEWIKARNKLMPKTLAAEGPLYGVKPPVLEEFGLNNLYANVDCWERGSQWFHMLQKGIHSDQNSDSYPYCCCAYMNGTLVESTCMKYKSNCIMGCLDYSMYRMKYKGLEDEYLGPA